MQILNFRYANMAFSKHHISKHLKGRSVPRVSDVFADAKGFVIFLFLDSFRIQRILSFSCFQTLPYLKDFVIFLFPESFCIERILSLAVSRLFPYSRDFVVSLFLA